MRCPSLHFCLGILALACSSILFSAEPKTERRYLSGKGPDDAVPWEFCVTGGRRAGEWTTIPVPSQWEQHGFGAYNYGGEQGRVDEHGLYRLRFTVPDAWKGRRVRLVFEGVMTDALVKVNGRVAGPLHSGAAYRFHFDITKTAVFGSEPLNLLEVDVAKASADPQVQDAERMSDYWLFGGIFRPVWLESAPPQSIENVAVDGRADGTFSARVTLASVQAAGRVEAQLIGPDGRDLGAPFSQAIPPGGTASVLLSSRVEKPLLWSAETPYLYSVRFALFNGADLVHTTQARFGFRTLEVRPGAGFFLNGRRILLKGVNRHNFRPATGRTLSAEDCHEEVRLMKEGNINAVRIANFPPDEAFLEACDELGLYALDELSGWQHAHNTETGRKLIRAMVERDVNHPCILFWNNGNEGGWNRELDVDFSLHDVQQRPVLHPWETYNGVDTKHYPGYDDFVRRLAGPAVFCPTEFLHALYDGGGGAGMEDYWNAVNASVSGGGGFLWVFSDEGIVRTDRGGRVDVFGSYAPDGIVGPNFEKEGSFHTIRDIWNPLQLELPEKGVATDGRFLVHNRYGFISTSRCRFDWKLLRYPAPAGGHAGTEVLASGQAVSPDIPPGASGALVIDFPKDAPTAEALALTARDPEGRELWTWTWPLPALAERNYVPASPPPGEPRIERTTDEIRLRAGALEATFDVATGLLRSVRRGGQGLALTNGPRLACARPEDPRAIEWLPTKRIDEATGTHWLERPVMANTIEVELELRQAAYGACKLELSPDGQAWKTLFDGSRRNVDGKLYPFPPQLVMAVRLTKVRDSNDNPLSLKSLRIGTTPARFAVPHGEGVAVVTTGEERAAPGGAVSAAWLESRGGPGLERFRWTLQADGLLRLDYAYSLTGDFVYHGITFDHAETQMKAVRWLGQGPFRVWKNRLRGTWLGVHSTPYNDLQPGDSFAYPEFQGCFAGVRWARLETSGGPLTLVNRQPDSTYLRLGTPRPSHLQITVDFPVGDISLLHGVQPMGSKFKGPEDSGPSARWNKASGTYTGTLLFQVAP